MISAPPKMQELLQAYGIEQHMMAYFNREEPNRLYVTAYGQLHFIDLSMINVMNGAIVQCGVEMLPVVEIEGNTGNGVQNLALKACELVRNDPTVRSDLENELNKVIQRVLSKLAEKRSKNDVTLATESLKCTSTSNWQMLTDSEREALQRERRKKNAYKTSLCRSFRENNICPYGEECVFAHGEKELRLPPQAHPKYKTQLCNKFSIWNYCPYGARCQYIHQRINEISRMDANLNAKENSEDNLEKNFLPVTLQHPSKRLILRRANKSTECISSPIALGNHSSFVERGGFTSSLTSTDFNCDENRKQSLESSDLFDPDYPNYDNNEFHLNTEAVTNNIILNQLHEHFNNMKIEDNNNLFSRSCFSRIGSGQVE